MLFRLALGRTVLRGNRSSREADSPIGEDSREGRWRAEVARRGISPPDAKPVVAGGRSLRFIWRKHYVAALIDEADRPAQQSMEDLGFEVIQFDDAADWRAAFARLASALGHVS